MKLIVAIIVLAISVGCSREIVSVPVEAKLDYATALATYRTELELCDRLEGQLRQLEVIKVSAEQTFNGTVRVTLAMMASGSLRNDPKYAPEKIAEMNDKLAKQVVDEREFEASLQVKIDKLRVLLNDQIEKANQAKKVMESVSK